MKVTLTIVVIIMVIQKDLAFIGLSVHSHSFIFV